MKMWALIIRTFQPNGLSSGYKDTQKFLYAILISVHSSAYPLHPANARSEVMKRFVTPKVICKTNDDASCLPCFK